MAKTIYLGVEALNQEIDNRLRKAIKKHKIDFDLDTLREYKFKPFLTESTQSKVKSGLVTQKFYFDNETKEGFNFLTLEVLQNVPGPNVQPEFTITEI